MCNYLTSFFIAVMTQLIEKFRKRLFALGGGGVGGVVFVILTAQNQSLIKK